MLKLIPTPTIVPCKEVWSWQSEGNDPAFIVDFPGSSSIKPGWYKFGIDIASDQDGGRAKLYLDTGGGFSEKETVCLNFKSCVPANRLFWLSRPVKALRFDPFESEARFSIQAFKVERVEDADAQTFLTQIASHTIESISLASFRLHSLYSLYDELLRTGQEKWLLRTHGISLASRALPAKEMYADWYASTRPTSGQLAKQKRNSDNWSDRPLLSVIVPCYESNPEWLNQLLHSIAMQTYGNWECIIIDDGSTNRAHLDVVRRYTTVDSRFRLIISRSNHGVSGTSRKGVEKARGNYVSVVDHDDLLEPDAFYEVAAVIRTQSPAVVYSDEALTDENGNVFRCELRPDFDYAFLLSHPYIVHLTFLRRDVVKGVGNFRRDYAVSQDYDLLLRVAAQTHDFFHIPKILYRWRVHATSTGHAMMNKVTRLSTASLNNHLKSLGLSRSEAWVESGLSFNFFRFRSIVPPCRVTVVIPTRDRIDLLRKCIDSLIGITRIPAGVELSISVVDNGSVDHDTLNYLEQFERAGHTVLRCPDAFNFSRINNLAAERARGDFLLFLNNDIEIVEPDWLLSMLELMKWSDVGAVGAKLLYPESGLVQHGGVIVGFNGAAAHDHQFYPERQDGHWSPGHLHTLLTIRECSALTAACMLVRRSAFNMVDGFDEKYAVGFGDTDLCLRLKKNGWRSLFTPYARLVHHESASRGHSNSDPHPEDTRLFKRRWRAFIKAGDPYYNPNLALTGTPYVPVVRKRASET